MYFDKGSIAKFLDGVAPFNDKRAAEMRAVPLVYKMACDIEELHASLELANKGLQAAGRIISRQRGIMLVSGCVILGGALYVEDRRNRKKAQERL